MTTVPTEMMTQEEVADWLRCSTRTVARLQARGEIPFVPGKPLLIRRSDVEAWMQAGVAARKEMVKEWNGSTWALPAMPKIGQGYGRLGGPKGKLTQKGC